MMKRIFMTVAAVAVAVTLSTPSFAGEGEDKQEEKKGGQVVIYGDEEKEKDKKGGYTDTFGDEDEKKDDKGK